MHWQRLFRNGMLGLLAVMAFSAAQAADFERLTVESASTSIYIGRVTLTMRPLTRQGPAYAADYRARVFPYLIGSERGSFRVDVSEDQLARLQRGERVPFTGEAQNTDGEPRHIEGHATPESPGAKHGTIKVRVFVTKKIQLIFNTTYRFD